MIWKYFDDDKMVVNIKDEQVFIKENQYRFQPYILFYKKIVEEKKQIGKIFKFMKKLKNKIDKFC